MSSFLKQEDYGDNSSETQSSDDADIVRIYQKEINKIPIPDPTEIRQLAEIIQSGKNAQAILDMLEFAEIPIEDEVLQIRARAEASEIAKKRLVTGHLRFAAHVARLTMGWIPFGYREYDEKGESVFRGGRIKDLSRFASAPFSLADRIQMANIGLIKAADNYKPDGGASFTTYAMYSIESEIQRAIQSDRNIRVPIHVLDVLGRITAIASQPDKTTQPSAGFAANYGPVDQKYVDEVTSTLSLEELEHQTYRGREDTEEDLPSLSETVTDRGEKSVEELAFDSITEEKVLAAMDRLPERERLIIGYRFGFYGEPMTLEQIGHIMDYSRENIRRLENQAIKRLRTYPEIYRLFL